MDHDVRSLIAFPCKDDTLVATVDAAPGATALLIVSGGNEVRAGAHRSMAMLAARLAGRGIPTFRYDRRGVGDSTGDNGGWAQATPDLAAAVVALRAAQPHVRRIVGFGNCDGAAALALFGRAAGIDALVLANPWLGDDDPLPPPAAIRARYAARLRDPREWLRLARGGVDLRRLVHGLRKASGGQSEMPLAHRLAQAMADLPLSIVLAGQDRTAQVFAESWRGSAFDAVRDGATVTTLPTGSHSFAGDLAALETVILAQVERLARESRS